MKSSPSSSGFVPTTGRNRLAVLHYSGFLDAPFLALEDFLEPQGRCITDAARTSAIADVRPKADIAGVMIYDRF